MLGCIIPLSRECYRFIVAIERYGHLRPSSILRSLEKAGRNNRFFCLLSFGMKVFGGAGAAIGASGKFVLGNIVRMMSSRHSDATLPLRFSGRKSGVLITLSMLSERTGRPFESVASDGRLRA